MLSGFELYARWVPLSKQRLKTTRRKLCCKKLGTSCDVKSFVIGSCLERFVVERANDYLCLKNIKNGRQWAQKPIDF